MIKFPVKINSNLLNVNLPQYATIGSAGADLCAAISENEILKPFERKLISTGISLEIAPGFEAQIRPRSGLALKSGITVLNSPGTIDSDYRGEIQVILINLGDKDFIITPGMRIAQMIVAKVEQVDFVVNEDLTESIRGASGFGSTGIESAIIKNKQLENI